MERLAILYDASQAVLSTFDLDEVLSHILSIVRDVLHVDKAAILLLDASTQELCVKTQFGWTLAVSKSACRWAAGLREAPRKPVSRCTCRTCARIPAISAPWPPLARR